MKKQFGVAFILLGALLIADADQFQFSRIKEGDKSYMSFATIKIVANNKTLFKGQTDKLGRIKIKLPNGQYEAVIIHGSSRTKTQAKVSLTIDGQKELKQVAVEQKGN